MMGQSEQRVLGDAPSTYRNEDAWMLVQCELLKISLVKIMVE